MPFYVLEKFNFSRSEGRVIFDLKFLFVTTPTYQVIAALGKEVVQG
jgi:hypothetical protein